MCSASFSLYGLFTVFGLEVTILKEQTPLYTYPGRYASEHGELEQYRASYQANIACKEAIEQSIAAHYGNNCLDPACVEPVVQQFGYERLFYVLANTVRQKDWDGRISQDNKSWAKTIPVCEDPDGFGGDRNVYFVVDRPHPGLTDLFLTQVRKAYALEQEKKPSLRETLGKTTGQQLQTAKTKAHKPQER